MSTKASTSPPQPSIPESGSSLGAGPTPLGWLGALAWSGVAITAFHLAYSGLPNLGWMAALVPWAVIHLTRLPSARAAFYAAGALGLALYGPRLAFFWGIFGPAAIVLWAVLAIWVALFAALLRCARNRLGNLAALGLAPILWTGLEFFRSELYPLRFTWLNSGYALAWDHAAPLLSALGVYGVGFVFALTGAAAHLGHGRTQVLFLVAAVAPILLLNQLGNNWHASSTRPSGHELQVAGAQVESASESETIPILDRLVAAAPLAQLLVLPEYTLSGEPDATLLEWCRAHQRHLVIGGRAPLDGEHYHNTVFVLGTNGSVVFHQAKSVPIQFFQDGEPAKSQQLWNSPWGPLGLAICYDLSYSTVIDSLVRLGAVGLVIPTMDAAVWGSAQHRLHARVAPVRAAEHGLPVFRVASSGISQVVDARGRVTAEAPFEDRVEFITGTLALRGPGALPLDRWLAPVCSALCAVVSFSFLLGSLLARFHRAPPAATPSSIPHSPES